MAPHGLRSLLEKYEDIDTDQKEYLLALCAEAQAGELEVEDFVTSVRTPLRFGSYSASGDEARLLLASGCVGLWP